MRRPICTLAFLLLATAAAPGQETPITLKLSLAQTKYKPGELATFTLVVTNVSETIIALDTKPVKFINNGLGALATGELLRRVEVKDGKESLQAPGLVEFGGIQPAVLVRDVTLTLEPKGMKSLTFAARVEKDRLLFDDPASPGLKRFGARLNREAYSFPLSDGRLKLRLVYHRGGITATSNDVTLEIEKGN